MHKNLDVWLVDAFATEEYRGNPAAVVVVKEFFDDRISLAIAQELNQVETAFVKILDKHNSHIRWFSPEKEVTMCGHATLAAAHILWEETLIEEKFINFQTLSGNLSVKKHPKGLALDLPKVKTGASLSDPLYGKIVNVEPICIVEVGDDVIIEVSHPDIVRHLEFDISKLLVFNNRAIIVTSRGDRGFDFVSRLFAPKIGIAEDAVSAASHSKLADFWSQRLGKTEFRAYQASARGGVLEIELKEERVHIIGQALTAMKGKLFLSNISAM